jgi:hypothetical protein
MSNSVVRDVPGPDRKQRIEQARELCAEALEICDSLNVSPESAPVFRKYSTPLRIAPTPSRQAPANGPQGITPNPPIETSKMDVLERPGTGLD